MRLAELTGRRVALLGLGADVRAALPAVRAAAPASLVVVDDSPAAEDGGLVRVPLDEAAADAEVFVRSPGFPRYRPELQAALAAGAPMTTPLDLWLGSFGSARIVVAVTGTKGKSTVTDLIGSLAARHGFRVGVAGNLGPPVFSTEWDADAPVVVLEVSSYQAADLHHVPNVAVLTFLAEDHLSWHGGVERYVADKLRVVRNEAGTASRVLVPPPARGGRIGGALEALGIPAEVVEPPPAVDSVPAHRLQNAALAAAALVAVGGPALTGAEVAEAARSSLPGRLDVVPGPGGVLCVDDALASNPSATAAGLAWLRESGRPTVVLLGGEDRGVDPAPLRDEVARWPARLLLGVVLPDSGEDLARACGMRVVASAASVADAVQRGLAALRSDDAAVGSGPGALIFSPAAPTPTGTGNWQTRSTEFRRALADASA